MVEFLVVECILGDRAEQDPPDDVAPQCADGLPDPRAFAVPADQGADHEPADEREHGGKQKQPPHRELRQHTNEA